MGVIRAWRLKKASVIDLNKILCKKPNEAIHEALGGPVFLPDAG